MKTLVVVPDGVAIRNFLCTSFCRQLLEHGPVTIWHALPEASVRQHAAQVGERVRWVRLPTDREPIAERIVRQAKIYGQLYWQGKHDGSSVFLRLLGAPRHWVARLVQVAGKVVGRVLAHRPGLAALERIHFALTSRRGSIDAYTTLLAEERPDVVFCAHQRAGRAVPAITAARMASIPTATFVYSWDNLPKGRMAVRADHVLVWSDHMRAELLRYYPEMEPARVWVVGTPQFEHYFDRSLVAPRDVFLRDLGLDPDRPVICYSGCDVMSARYDPHYLADLATWVQEQPESDRPQILFRRSPGDFSDRYQAVLEADPDIVVSDPAWLVTAEGDWSQTVATFEDVRLLANVVHHCDLVVNVGSTMGMDFAILDKPSVFIVYDPPDAEPRFSVHLGYSLPHFDLVRAHKPVYWVEDRRDLGPAVEEALRDPAVQREGRNNWLETQVAHPLDQASKRCVEALVGIAAVKRS